MSTYDQERDWREGESKGEEAFEKEIAPAEEKHDVGKFSE